MRIALALISALVLCAPAWADPARCRTAYDAEVARIEREALPHAPPPGSDVRTQQQFMAGVHARLEAAARRAEQCEQASRPKPDAAARQATQIRQQQCAELADREYAMLRQRGGGNSPEQQRDRREAEMRIMDERMACMRNAER